MIGAAACWVVSLVLAAALPGLLAFILIADLIVFILLFVKRKEIMVASAWLAVAVVISLIHIEVGCTTDAMGNPDRYFETKRELVDRWLVLEHTNLASNHTMKTINAFRRHAGSPSRKSTEGRRIIALGTSSTWGEDVEGDKTWPAAMSESLKGRDYSATVLNAGLSGYNLFQLAIYARDVLAHYSPDMVILYYGANEGISESTKSWYRETKKALEAANLPTVELREKAILYNTTKPGSIRLLDALHSSFFARRIIRKMQYFSHYGTPRVDGANPQPPYKPEPPFFDEVLSEFVKDQVGRKVPLLLVPEIANTGGFASEPVAKAMAEIAQGFDGVYFVDLSSAFADVSPKDYFLNNDFIHPNEKGHALLGDLLAVKAMEILPPLPEAEELEGDKKVEVEAKVEVEGGVDVEVEVGVEAG